MSETREIQSAAHPQMLLTHVRVVRCLKLYFIDGLGSIIVLAEVFFPLGILGHIYDF